MPNLSVRTFVPSWLCVIGLRSDDIFFPLSPCRSWTSANLLLWKAWMLMNLKPVLPAVCTSMLGS